MRYAQFHTGEAVGTDDERHARTADGDHAREIARLGVGADDRVDRWSETVWLGVRRGGERFRRGAGPLAGPADAAAVSSVNSKRRSPGPPV